MARFVVGSGPFFLFGHDHAAALRPHKDFVFGFFKILHFHQAGVAARSHQSRLIAQISQVGSAHARRAACDDGNIHVLRDWNFAHVHIQNLLAATNIGQRDIHLAVKTARAQQGLVENVGAVGCSNHDYAQIGFEPVHFHQHLVQGLLALVVTAAQACATLAAYGINLVDKDDARRVLFGVFKHVAHAGRAHADKHFHKVRTADAEERHFGFARNGLGQQRFAGARRAYQQQAARDAPPQFLEFLRIFQKVHHFLDFFLGLVSASHVGESDLVIVFVHHAGFAFAKAEGAAFAAALHLPHHVEKHRHQQKNRAVVHQKQQQQRAFFARLDVELDVRLDQIANQALIHAGGRGAHGLVVYRSGGNFSAAPRPFLNRGFFDLAIIDLRDEFGIVQSGDAGCLTPFKMLV